MSTIIDYPFPMGSHKDIHTQAILTRLYRLCLYIYAFIRLCNTNKENEAVNFRGSWEEWEKLEKERKEEKVI